MLPGQGDQGLRIAGTPELESEDQGRMLLMRGTVSCSTMTNFLNACHVVMLPQCPARKAAQMPLEQHQELLQVSQMWVATLQQLRAKFDEKTMTRLEDMFMQGLLSLNCQIQVFFPLAWQNAH